MSLYSSLCGPYHTKVLIYFFVLKKSVPITLACVLSLKFAPKFSSNIHMALMIQALRAHKSRIGSVLHFSGVFCYVVFRVWFSVRYTFTSLPILLAARQPVCDYFRPNRSTVIGVSLFSTLLPDSSHIEMNLADLC